MRLPSSPAPFPVPWAPKNLLPPFPSFQHDLPRLRLAILSCGPSFHLQVMDETEARHFLKEVYRVAKRHVFILVMTCGITASLPACEARKHPWVKQIQAVNWWSKVSCGPPSPFRCPVISHC